MADDRKAVAPDWALRKAECPAAQTSCHEPKGDAVDHAAHRLWDVMRKLKCREIDAARQRLETTPAHVAASLAITDD